MFSSRQTQTMVFSIYCSQSAPKHTDECLNYAIDNRREWENKGKNIVQELVSSFITRETEEAPPGVKQRSMRFARRRSLMTSGG